MKEAFFVASKKKETENYLCGRKGDKLPISYLPSDRVVFPIFSILLFLLIIFRRMSVGKLQPPVIPFMPLLLKDMTFAHEGNKTSLDGLVNFEKMHMMAQTMRSVRFCRSRHLGKENNFRFFFVLNDFMVTNYVKIRHFFLSGVLYHPVYGAQKSKNSKSIVILFSKNLDFN